MSLEVGLEVVDAIAWWVLKIGGAWFIASVVVAVVVVLIIAWGK